MTESGLLLNRPLVVRSPNWLGDAVMALPAVRNLKQMLGPDTLAVATPPKLAALWQACPFVDQVISLHRPRSIPATARQLRTGGFGAALLLPNSFRAAAEVWLAGIPQRIGYARSARSYLLDHPIPVPERNPARMHQSNYYLDLVSALGGPDDGSMPELRRPEPAESTDARPVIAICPGAEYGPAKRWPIEYFLEVARYFHGTHRARIVLLGAPGDALAAALIEAQFSKVDNRAGKTSLAEFMAVLCSARFVLCNDSGAMHVAAALGRPTIAVFGSTEPQMTGPMGTSACVLRHHVPCSPCFLRECPIDFACMRSITPDKVIAAGEAMMK